MKTKTTPKTKNNKVTKRKPTNVLLPKIIKGIREQEAIENNPLGHYSYSSMVKFSTNPFMFKVKYLNGDHIDTGHNASSVVGKAFHIALQAYYESKKDPDKDEIKIGLEEGMKYLDEYNDNYITFNDTYPNKQKIQETFAFTYNTYVTEKDDTGEKIVSTEEEIQTTVRVEWRGKELQLPVPLKGFIDKIIEEQIKEKDELVVIDYKTTRAFSDPDKIDGAKIIQAIQYYFLVYAYYGRAPYSMRYEEVKTTKNSGKNAGQPQMKEYEMVYAENDLFFDFYFRFYEDMTRAINGEAVFVPNINDFYDNEVALIAYTYRLDEPDEKAKLMKKMRVENITDLLKKKIENAGSMRKFLMTAEKNFISAKNLNYNAMKQEEKIQTKLMEHGMLLKFDSKIEGHTVDLYQYTPSIGLKMSKLKSYVADIEQVTGASGIRILAPIPNTTMVGFEIPRKVRTFVKDKPATDGFKLAMGLDIMGNEYRFDIRKAPHMLIAGATGSGKSVFLNSLIDQISQNDKIELHLFDPKMVELAQFAKNSLEYCSDTEEIYQSISRLVTEMNERYKKLATAGVRNIEEYKGKMKYKVVVIDEFGDLVMSNITIEKEVETKEKYKTGELKGQFKTKIEKTNLSDEISRNILLLAQKARACGIHLIIATQRPSVDIITGTIKANFPTKVAFRTAKATDSQVLLDESGAEKLLGKGDMIFSSDDGQIRLQGYLI